MFLLPNIICNNLSHFNCNTMLQYCQEVFLKNVDRKRRKACFQRWRGTVKGLKEIRKKKRLSQLKVAMDLNISREALSYYENGKRNPDINMLIAMSNYFNVSIDFLITGKEFSPR